MTGSMLNVSPDLQLPLDAVTQTFAVIGVRRSGKSNAGAVMAEEMYDHQLPWVAIDPKGDWWGLRSNAAGDGPGLQVPIFGGLHGDLPLLPESGLMAELIVEHNLTCILDVSRFSKAARIRFLVPFAERLYELHQEHPQPRHIFLEEASRLLPQQVRQDMAACVGAFVDLIRLGGAFGLGMTLLDQRCATLNKDGLTQVETFIGLRITSPQDRKAVHDWMEHHAIATEIVDSLPALKSGEGWVSSSHFLTEHGLPAIQRIRFRQRRTFDSGATPKVGQVRPVATLADIDLGQLETRMADVVDKAAENDPKALRMQLRERDKRITDLERQLAGRGGADPAKVRALQERITQLENRPPERVEVPAIPRGDLQALQELATSLAESLGTVRTAVDVVIALQQEQPPASARPPAPAPPRAPRPRPHVADKPTAPAATEPAGDTSLKKGARIMLGHLARQHPMRMTRTQLATMSRIKSTGSTFSSYLSNLRTAGLIEEDGRLIWLSADGLAAAGADIDAAPMSSDEVIAQWRTVLKRGARLMLDYLVERYPDPVSRADLAAALEIDPSGSTFSSYLSNLRTNGLAEASGSDVRAADALFGGA